MASFDDVLKAVLWLGYDSFLGGVALGAMVRTWPARAGSVMLFGACDGLATLLGAAMSHRLCEAAAVALYLVGVGLVILGAWRARAWLFALPLLLSLDNLVAGRPGADAAALGLGSAALAASGIALGALARRAALSMGLARMLR